MTESTNDGGGGEPALQVTGLERSFRGFRLGPIDLTLEAGRVLAYVGRNGAGKTTSIHCINGLLRRSGGDCGRGAGGAGPWRAQLLLCIVMVIVIADDLSHLGVPFLGTGFVVTMIGVLIAKGLLMADSRGSSGDEQTSIAYPDLIETSGTLDAAFWIGLVVTLVMLDLVVYRRRLDYLT